MEQISTKQKYKLKLKTHSKSIQTIPKLKLKKTLLMNQSQNMPLKCGITTGTAPSVVAGDETEMYILSLIKESALFKDAERIGFIESKYDIIYRDIESDLLRGLQVKTFCENKERPNTWTMNNIKPNAYQPDTLIVGTNKERNRFCLLFYKDCQTTTLSLCFDCATTKYESAKYVDLLKFKQSLYLMAKQSTVINDYKDGLVGYHKREADYMDILKLKCDTMGLAFIRNTTHASVIDCFINNYGIQCKTSSSKHRKQYKFALQKRSNGKHIPFEETDDVEFFVFQIADETYQNDVCIIPKKIMIEKGFIKTKTQLGIKIIGILPSDEKKSQHWTQCYWNRFDLLSNPTTPPKT